MTQIFPDFDMALIFATANMAFALVLGAIIGTERQFRGRMAGLRTNALVALGSAGFVTFAALFPDDINPTRVAAQVVSGIGFLGAGIIFRDGFNIQGINTAATLWCSAAVGLISGSGHILYAITLTSLIVFSNLGLRPIVRRLKSAAAKNTTTEKVFQLRLLCLNENQKDVRAAFIACLAEQALVLSQIAVRGDGAKTQIIALVSDLESADAQIERVICQMSLDTKVLRADWKPTDDDALDFEVEPKYM